MSENCKFWIIILSNFQSEALDFLKDVIIIIVIVMIIRTFFVMPFQINGQSMADSYYDREFIIVDRLSYREFPVLGALQEVERGDVVIFTPGVDEDRKYFIKRVIGLPGDTIEISDGKVYVQELSVGEFIELNESGYLNEENNGSTFVSGNLESNTYVVPDGQYFVLGDNRTQSTDSRRCFRSCVNRSEYISLGEITGKVLLDLWYFSFSEFAFTHPDLGINTKPKFFSSPGTHTY